LLVLLWILHHLANRETKDQDVSNKFACYEALWLGNHVPFNSCVAFCTKGPVISISNMS
jgi:hypothetical protein